MCPNKRELQRIERRQQILECGLDMIVSRGYDAVKIRDIAEELDISTGLFFNYFESKEKLYEELVKIGLTAPADVFAMYSTELSPIDFFERITEFIFEALKSYSITAKIFLLMSQTYASGLVPESVKNILSGFDVVAPILDIIRKGQRLGQIKRGNPAVIAMAYWGGIHGIAQCYTNEMTLPLPESSWVVDIIRA
jgi:AcrR family transcriptional regulator